MNEKEIEAALEAALVPASVVATILGVTVWTIYNLVKVGRLEAVNISTGSKPSYRVKTESVKRLLETRQTVNR